VGAEAMNDPQEKPRPDLDKLEVKVITVTVLLLVAFLILTS